jgi:uncharacterized protein YbbC (DUF1343 family)
MITGLEQLLSDPKRWLGKARVGLLANPTAVDTSLHHAIELMDAHPDVDLRLLFGPEHGIHSEAQDMVGVGQIRDPVSGLRVASLYGESVDSLVPKPDDLDEIDVLVFDIQDVGARYYTYAATMALCMRAAAATGTRIVVLDRPNPIGGLAVEGGGLESGLESIVGLYPVPQRHAMTIGELAQLYNTAFAIGCQLQVIPCRGWRRSDYYDETGLPWVMPSPNMPTLDTAIVYPGMCLLEGTNLSEGRGTTRPFELFGAPYIDSRVLAAELARCDLPGVTFRPCVIRPTFHKYAGQSCAGLQAHVTDRRVFLPYRTGLAVLTLARRLWPADFDWRHQAYEFRSDVPAIDLLTGIPAVREGIDAGHDFETIVRVATAGTENFAATRRASLLY